ncbi:MAG: hypothetical protein PVI43_00515 [Candidatus Bathyarchaeota archaeon]|jgi:hypothetical protein
MTTTIVDKIINHLNTLTDDDKQALEKIYECAFDRYYATGDEYAHGIDQALAALSGSVELEELEENLQ